MDRMMSDDYVYVAPSGRILDRQAILAVIRSPGYSLDHGVRSEVVVAPARRQTPAWSDIGGRAAGALKARSSKRTTAV